MLESRVALRGGLRDSALMALRARDLATRWREVLPGKRRGEDGAEGIIVAEEIVGELGQAISDATIGRGCT
jgi:hypothetical protein